MNIPKSVFNVPLPKIPQTPTWHSTLEDIKKYVVYISTPNGTGTGFLIASSKEERIVGIATALHVISNAHEWGQPIKIRYDQSDATVLLKESDRSIHWDKKTDSALIRFSNGKIKLPIENPSLIERDKHMKEGVELGWCGYPAVYSSKLCFFSGRVSAWLDDHYAYLVDGVAINGVSGGPAFEEYGDIVGFVTAYIPNRATGEALPGVSLIRSIAPYMEWFDELKKIPPKASSDSPLPKKSENGIETKNTG